MRKLLYLGILACGSAWSAEPIDVGFELASSLPREFVEYLHTANELDPYALDAWLNPFYLQADFNGDGSKDIAVLLREKATDKAGVVIVHGSTNESFVLGAGFTVGNGGDDFSWLGAWHVRPRGPVIRGPFNETEAPVLSGDALYVEKLESASGLIYWTGSSYEWYHRAD